MAVKEFKELVNQCCSFCCKAVDFGTHDYCPSSAHCASCEYDYLEAACLVSATAAPP